FQYVVIVALRKRIDIKELVAANLGCLPQEISYGAFLGRSKMGRQSIGYLSYGEKAASVKGFPISPLAHF
ncbi:hypothetical protein, partial [Escherichia coli]|uniref:hypothetical protein n=1 Tax=Escherichia coli TaxID=562 RepID=UPI001965B318